MHVEKSHLSRVPLPCPVKGIYIHYSHQLPLNWTLVIYSIIDCSDTFVRHYLLPTHVENSHDIKNKDDFSRSTKPTQSRPSVDPEIDSLKAKLSSSPLPSSSVLLFRPPPNIRIKTSASMSKYVQEDEEMDEADVPMTLNYEISHLAVQASSKLASKEHSTLSGPVTSPSHSGHSPQYPLPLSMGWNYQRDKYSSKIEKDLWLFCKTFPSILYQYNPGFILCL